MSPMFRSCLLMVMSLALVAADAPPNPERPWSEVLPDGRVRTWVPAGYAVQRTTASEQYETWVPGHWAETPVAASSAPVTVHECRRESRTVVHSGLFIAPMPLVMVNHRWRHNWGVAVGVGWPLWMGCRHGGWGCSW